MCTLRMPTAGSGLSDDQLRSLLDSLERPTPALARLLAVARSPEGLAGMAAEALATGPSAAVRRSRSPTLPRASSAKSVRAAEALLALVVDYANGMTQAEIAKKHGIHVQTLRKRLQKAGVNTRARVRLLSSAQVQAARSAIADGASLRATARQLDVSHTTLLRNLQQGQS